MKRKQSFLILPTDGWQHQFFGCHLLNQFFKLRYRDGSKRQRHLPAPIRNVVESNHQRRIPCRLLRTLEKLGVAVSTPAADPMGANLLCTGAAAPMEPTKEKGVATTVLAWRPATCGCQHWRSMINHQFSLVSIASWGFILTSSLSFD